MIIGITGGVGAGKSSVLDILRHKFGAKVILADLVAHDLMEPGMDGLKRVTDALGTSFIQEDGSVNRQKLAETIFHDAQALATMNSIIHPMVWEYIQNEALTCEEQLVIVEAAVFDTAPQGLFNEMWYVYTTEENRISRLMASRGYSKEKCMSIIEKQDSEEEFRARCGRVIDNNGSSEETEMQIKEILGNEIC
ncbi:MAG: dephospho-CoA kinase [Lachnospiraceae bacterium]|nr:dephospho-CoA kinase [Lachnospiraceae bacterium]